MTNTIVWLANAFPFSSKKIAENYFKLEDNHINMINSYINNLYKIIDIVQPQDL